MKAVVRPPDTAPASRASILSRFGQPPTSVGQLAMHVAASWLVLGVLALILSLLSWYLKIAAAALFVTVTTAAAYQLWLILNARQRVLSRKSVSLLWGQVQLISWDPVEGVLILKNKAVHFYDHNLDDGGGIRFLYPILGEELALRVPLEVQTLQFADQNVLTREYFRLSVRGTMKWRIVDIRSFYLTVSRQLRKTADEPEEQSDSSRLPFVPPGDHDQRQTRKQLLQSSIEWLRVLAEADTREVISRVSCGLLMAERVSNEIPELSAEKETGGGDRIRGAKEMVATQIGGSEFVGAAQGLAAQIQRTIAEKLQPYGIAVEDVSLQEVGLPEEIVRECINACKTAYLPLVAARQASGERAKLQAQVELLGRDYVGTREVISVAKARLPDFLENFMKGRLPVLAAPIVGVNVETDHPIVSASNATEAKSVE